MRCCRAVLVVFLFALLPIPAYAWNRPTHMVTGAIAYDLLASEHPKTLARALELLRQHPQYETVISKRLESVPAVDRDRYLFMLAARWPDDVRNDEKYHRSQWHYINFPYVPPGQPAADVPAPAEANILTAIASNAQVVKGNASDGDRAVALCWMFHLVGDIHQPLHTSALISSQFPQGDRGGNLFFVRVSEGMDVVQ